MEIVALGYVGVEVTNLEAWEEFGPEVLGLTAQREDGVLRLRMDERSYRIAVHAGGENRLAYCGWELPSEGALETALRELEAAGLEPRRGSAEECQARQVRALVSCEDPLGNRVELFAGARAAAEPFHPARPISGFVAGWLGLGHVVVGVPDVAASGRFYTDVLGFRVSDVAGDRFLFMHCNPRHHSIALAGLGGSGLHHIMLEAQSLDDVGRTYDVCLARSVPISRGLGRHSNDLMVSFYMESPSGFEVEYGWNGRLIDDATWTVEELSSTSLWGHHPVSEKARARFAARLAGR